MTYVKKISRNDEAKEKPREILQHMAKKSTIYGKKLLRYDNDRDIKKKKMAT